MNHRFFTAEKALRIFINKSSDRPTELTLFVYEKIVKSEHCFKSLAARAFDCSFSGIKQNCAVAFALRHLGTKAFYYIPFTILCR